MKLVTYDTGGSGPRSGVLIEDARAVVDLVEAAGPGTASDRALQRLASVQTIIEGGDASLDAALDVMGRAPASARRLRDEVRLLAPVQPPIQMRDCLCFEGHLLAGYPNLRRLLANRSTDPEARYAELERAGVLAVPGAFYEGPIYYKANRFAVVGTGHDVRWPSYSELLDFELEFGVYIKGTATDVPKERARDHIFGYTIFNDFSARDTQLAEMGALGPAKAKDFDTANVMGPCLVTADELTDPYALTMIARVNGEEWTRASSRTMMWSFEDLIAHISRSETLYPGEFLGSGTVEGGCGLELMRFLSPGDVVELEVEGIGILSNRVVRAEATR